MKTHVEKRFLVGILLLIAGVVLMLKYYDIVLMEVPPWVFTWKSILVLLGLVFLVTDRNKTTGLVLFLIGGVFLAAYIFSISVRDVLRFTIPLVLIVAGLAMLMKRKSFSARQINVPEDENVNDYINDVSIFGGAEKKIHSKNFKGGKLTAIFGGAEFDLRTCELASGINAIDMVCIFGGTTLRVPEDWVVVNDVTAIFGGFSDERTLNEDTTSKNPEKVLYLKGLVLFGGGEIK